jgi:hypothetical protein
MAAESLLVRQGLRATGGDGSHMAVEDAVSAHGESLEEVGARSASGHPDKDHGTKGRHFRHCINEIALESCHC